MDPDTLCFPCQVSVGTPAGEDVGRLRSLTQPGKPSRMLARGYLSFRTCEARV